ncbi:MAG: DUF4339 domain-containing protein, partial [Thermoguttaceae bacterium]|nr:DUF4339 domain-containing protein [Thermoguttaceae bacterium]
TAPGSEQNFSGDFSSTPAETVSAGAKWYVSNNGVTGTGPFTDSEIREQLKNGRINEESLIWQEGGAALPIRKVPEFSSGDKEDPADDPFSKKKGKNPGTENQSAFNIEGENSDEEESWDRKKRRSRVPTEPTPMYCKSCHLKFAEGHVTCPECNAILFEIPPKSRLVYVTLACLPTGGLGIHNFYAVHYTRAKIQMLMGLTAVCFPITWIWAIAEAVFLQTDGNGAHFRL